jgi:SAM-dependent methyltransferase
MSKSRDLSDLKRKLGDFPAIISDIIKEQGRATVLEIGCGYGLPNIQLEQMFGQSVSIYGINLNYLHCQYRMAAIVGLIRNELDFPKAINIFRGVGKPNYLCTDAGLSLPFPSGLFDFIYSRVALGFVKDKVRCIEEIYRVLRPGRSCRADLSIFRYYAHPHLWRSLFQVIRIIKTDHLNI